MYVNKIEMRFKELNIIILEICLILILMNEIKFYIFNLELGIFILGNFLDINIILNMYFCLNGILCLGIIYLMKLK